MLLVILLMVCDSKDYREIESHLNWLCAIYFRGLDVNLLQEQTKGIRCGRLEIARVVH